TPPPHPPDTPSASVRTSEDSSNHDSTVGLDQDVIDPGVKPKDRRETVIKSAIRVETHHASFATMSIVGQNFSIRLNGKRGTAHVHVEASWQNKACIKRAIIVESRKFNYVQRANES